MAGHSQFKNIMHRKGAQDSKRAKIFTKILREVTVSAKVGGADATTNARLRNAMITAREANVPKDKIQNAINKATSAAEGDNYDEMRYEGYGPNGIALIVEALTDNRNRTASEVRSSFTKYGGQLGESGSVSFMFKRIGLIHYPKNGVDFEEMLEAAIEAGAYDCVELDDAFEIISTMESFNEVRDFLEKKFGEASSAVVTWKPNTLQVLDKEQAEKLMKMLEALEDCDDVQNVIGNYEFPKDFLN